MCKITKDVTKVFKFGPIQATAEIFEFDGENAFTAVQSIITLFGVSIRIWGEYDSAQPWTCLCGFLSFHPEDGYFVHVSANLSKLSAGIAIDKAAPQTEEKTLEDES